MLNYAEGKEIQQQTVPEWFSSPEIDLPLLDSLIDDNNELGTDAVLKNTSYNCLLKPFEMEWVFGFDVNVPVINLSDEERCQIFYTASNIGILYNYCTKTMNHLRGHQSKIVSVCLDKTGQWLATADNGPDNTIMIWDTHKATMVWTIFNHPPSGNNLLLIGMSPSAKLLVIISDQDETTIEFWLWTYGKDAPDDTYTNENNLGAPKSIEFHPNKEQHFMIVFEKSVLFFCWDFESNKVTKTIHPKTPSNLRVGHYSDATYVNHCHESFVASSKGSILVFGTTIYARNYADEAIDNEKFYVKCIKISRAYINCLTSIDQLIVTGDSNGTIMFFDKCVKLLYWISRQITKPIKSISFKLNPRKYNLVHQETTDTPDNAEDTSSGLINECFVDFSDEYERLILEQVPRDATLENRPFITRDFFIKTADGTMYLMNVIDHRLLPIFPTADSNVAAIDVHEEMPYLVIAYTKGRMVLFNYETEQEVLTTFLPETDPDALITTVKYSSQCLHLACGRSNGELWFLQPVLLAQIYVDPFKFSNDKVVSIAFSQSSLQMAYFDSNMTVFAFYYDTDTEDWIFKGKVRSHYKDICNMLFLDEDPFGLYTIGKDRHLIKYTNIADNDEELDILTRDRIEQKDIPMYFIPYPRGKFSKSGYFLIADDKHKYKAISSRTSMCTAVYLGPAYGCFKDSHVRKMEFLPKSNKKYLIFMTKKHFGIQMMPVDGNPFKFVGCLGHPDEIADFKISNDGRHVFTVGKDDRTVFMWKVRTTSVETMHILGGLELQPYYCLIEGGRGGFLYQEMRDLFYYMQILQQGEQISAPRTVTNYINIGELPDLMRACGYYPSEYEIENLLTDIRYKLFDDSGILKDKVTFCEFVKLFINHKPAYGYTIDALEEAFEAITTFTDEYGGSDMPRDDFIEALTTTGEQVSTEQIYRCFATLLHAETTSGDLSGERDFGFMPDSIDFDFLAEDVLGLDLDALERGGGGDDDDDDVPYYYYSN
ncbi:cilia- and flagella-associated protein 251-like [Zophobas morio]|uniref:cilia- and flagella-associated protein 251-like n=1 Tax=Zophobas morio TaxID=2755281 RepID=UPI0030832BDE